MSERDSFGPRLRRERERRGISLETIVTRTNVSLELWLGFESNDFSRWPTGIFARAFVRDYAKAVGLDPDEVVDDFCRLYPLGDRRLVPVIRAQAELIGHETTVADDRRLMPDGVDRRGSDRRGNVPAPPAAAPQRLVRIFRAIFHT
jgi:cytoskeletal protein RodZ